MEENKWNNRMTHLTSFAMGVILTTLMISKGWLSMWIWILLFSVIILMVFLVYKWIEGIDYMDRIIRPNKIGRKLINSYTSIVT